MSAESEFWLEIFKATSTFGIASIAAYITATFAKKQWKTAQSKLILDLFDRRFEIYKEIDEVINGYHLYGLDNLKDENIMKFASAKHRSKFLFGDETYRYLDSINDDLLKARSISNRMKSAPNNKLEQMQSDLAQREERLEAFFDEYDKMVLPYMRIDQKMP